MNAKFALITFLDGPPSIGGGVPDNSLPGNPVYPSNELPGGGHISTLPVYPFDPTIPSNELPGGGYPTPGPIVPGKKFIVKWLACVGLILVPDNSLPGGEVDNTLPETAEPK